MVDNIKDPINHQIVSGRGTLIVNNMDSRNPDLWGALTFDDESQSSRLIELLAGDPACSDFLMEQLENSIFPYAKGESVSDVIKKINEKIIKLSNGEGQYGDHARDSYKGLNILLKSCEMWDSIDSLKLVARIKKEVPGFYL